MDSKWTSKQIRNLHFILTLVLQRNIQGISHIMLKSTCLTWLGFQIETPITFLFCTSNANLSVNQAVIEAYMSQLAKYQCWNKRRNQKKSEFAFGLDELVRQTNSVHTSNVSYLYYLNRIKGKIINEMNGNYTGNERSRAVKLRAAVLGVADIARARNSHFNFPTNRGWQDDITALKHPGRLNRTHIVLTVQFNLQLSRVCVHLSISSYLEVTICIINVLADAQIETCSRCS